ncbi:MAG: serine/threonine-protein phosphatase [Armatimonadota bacterium]|nr:MAG: serine/threonine-protein phosphatase [Armatimonadota bacterium]
MILPEPRLELEGEATVDNARSLANPETAVAIFRTAFVALTVVTLFRSSRVLGSFTPLHLVAILAATYNVALLIMYWRGLYFPGHRHFILSLDIVFITLWVALSRVLGLGPGFFPLYYALVFIAALWFGIVGAALTALVSGALYIGILAGVGPYTTADIAETLRQHVLVLFLVVILIGYIAQAQQRERAASERTRTALARYQQHRRLMQDFYDLINPQQLSPPPGLDVGVGFRAAVRMGAGDYYDLLRLEGGRYGLCVADVAGKYGAEVLRVPVVKYALKVAAAVEHRPSRVLERVNELVFDELQPDRFVTMFYAQVDPLAAEVTYVNAGHDPPLLIRSDNTVETLEAGGLVLGVLRDARYEEEVVRLAAGDALVLYTDGAVEATNAAGAEFGAEQLQDTARAVLVGAGSAKDAALGMLAAIENFARGGARRDDVTIMVIRLAPRPAAVRAAAADDDDIGAQAAEQA